MIFLVISLLSTNPDKLHHPMRDCREEQVIREHLAFIVKAESGIARAEKAEALAMLFKNMDSKCVKEEDLSILKKLLLDRDDSVRFWAATIIGNIGYRARTAIPALTLALSQRPCEGMGLTSASAIRGALQKLKIHRNGRYVRKVPEC